jgi:hypothetical protein
VIDPRDITVVLQGAVPGDAPGRSALRAQIARLRRMLPGATVVLSTWTGRCEAGEFPVDQTCFSSDPGELPPYKLGACKPNHVNRQIVSSAAGLAAATTPFAMKLRCDARLQDTGFLRALAAQERREPGCTRRIVTVGRFSIDPHLFEQMPFHLSDWFQFGPTPRLQALWSAPLMTAADATHYRRTPHAAHATLFDRRFVARWPAEQHVWRAYAASLGYAVPGFHNDVAPAVLDSHDRFVAREVLLLDLPQAGVQLPALAWAERSGMQRFNCLTHLDWMALAAREAPWSLSAAEASAVRRRQEAKRRVRRLFHAARPLLPLLVRPPLKPVVSRLLRAADPFPGPCNPH